MIKGVNKQIIEIKCPNDEHFEKILLFVNAEKCRASDRELDEKAKRLAKQFLIPSSRKRAVSVRNIIRENKMTVGVCAAAVAGAAVYAVSVFV
jgi:hypothetical protein